MSISRRGLYDSLEIFPGRGVVRSGHNESFEESNLTNIARGRVLYEDLHMKVQKACADIKCASPMFKSWKPLAAAQRSAQTPQHFADMPKSLKCPISLDLMSDPVIVLETGQTYDRQSIVHWFQSGKSTCPVTGKPLKSKEIVANPALKHTIDDWIRTKGWRVPTPKGGAACSKGTNPFKLDSSDLRYSTLHQNHPRFPAVHFSSLKSGTVLACPPDTRSHSAQSNSTLGTATSGMCTPSSSSGVVANAVQGGLNTSNPADHILPEINGWTYLHWAAAVDANEAAQANAQNEAIVLSRTTIQISFNGKDIDVGATPLHVSAIFGSERVAKALLLAHADVNAQDSSGNTPLHLAVFEGHLGLVEALIRSGANMQQRNFQGQSPYEYANGLHNFIYSDSNISPLDEFRMQEVLQSGF